MNLTDILELKSLHEKSWQEAYSTIPLLINERGLMNGAEIGIAFGGHAERILSQSGLKELYGVDSFRHITDYDDPMNLSDDDFELLLKYTTERLSKFGGRFNLIRETSNDATVKVPDDLDFVYIDADHTYNGLIVDLVNWYKKVRVGGIIAGHDYGHVNFPGVSEAVNRFFGRFNYQIHVEDNTVWWVEKKDLPISFIVPAYNCESTIEEAINSIVATNLNGDDEIVIVNDASSDNTETKLNQILSANPNIKIKIVKHSFNKGGGAARNTAVENTSNELIFCLDSDNVLESSSVKKLKDCLVNNLLDTVAFNKVRYFKDKINEVTHEWIFKTSNYTLQDIFLSDASPGADGNYLFTKQCWKVSHRYPEEFGALDTWGFGFKQLLYGFNVTSLEGTYYFHRYGYESYFVRDSAKKNFSLLALGIISPYLHIFTKKTIESVLSKDSGNWFSKKETHPLEVDMEALNIFQKSNKL